MFIDSYLRVQLGIKLDFEGEGVLGQWRSQARRSAGSWLYQGGVIRSK